MTLEENQHFQKSQDLHWVPPGLGDMSTREHLLTLVCLPHPASLPCLPVLLLCYPMCDVCVLLDNTHAWCSGTLPTLRHCWCHCLGCKAFCKMSILALSFIYLQNFCPFPFFFLNKWKLKFLSDCLLPPVICLSLKLCFPRLNMQAAKCLCLCIRYS